MDHYNNNEINTPIIQSPSNTSFDTDIEFDASFLDKCLQQYLDGINTSNDITQSEITSTVGPQQLPYIPSLSSPQFTSPLNYYRNNQNDNLENKCLDDNSSIFTNNENKTSNNNSFFSIDNDTTTSTSQQQKENSLKVPCSQHQTEHLFLSPPPPTDQTFSSSLDSYRNNKYFKNINDNGGECSSSSNNNTIDNNNLKDGLKKYHHDNKKNLSLEDMEFILSDETNKESLSTKYKMSDYTTPYNLIDKHQSPIINKRKYQDTTQINNTSFDDEISEYSKCQNSHSILHCDNISPLVLKNQGELPLDGNSSLSSTISMQYCPNCNCSNCKSNHYILKNIYGSSLQQNQRGKRGRGRPKKENTENNKQMKIQRRGRRSRSMIYDRYLPPRPPQQLYTDSSQYYNFPTTNSNFDDNIPSSSLSLSSKSNIAVTGGNSNKNNDDDDINHFMN